jgi:hypothetical protein
MGRMWSCMLVVVGCARARRCMVMTVGCGRVVWCVVIYSCTIVRARVAVGGESVGGVVTVAGHMVAIRHALRWVTVVRAYGGCGGCVASVTTIRDVGVGVRVGRAWSCSVNRPNFRKFGVSL